MSLSKQRNMPSYDFPEEILSEILKRLPVRSVLSCGAVQKSWYHLIRTPMFISLHSNYQKMTAHVNPKYLLFPNLDTYSFTVRSDDAQCHEYCNHALDWRYTIMSDMWYAQSNGLICLSDMFDTDDDYVPSIILCNPLVKKYKFIPDLPFCKFTFEETGWSALAFGFSPEVNDYVVVHIVKLRSSCPLPDPPLPYKQYPHTVVIGVYSLNTNSWKKLSQDKVFVDCMITDESVFVNGTAFWIGCNSDEFSLSVMYFDTKTNTLQTIKVPTWTDLHEQQLYSQFILPFGQSIAYFIEVEDDDYWDIWVLKDNMIDEFSWEKKMSVSISENVLAQVLGIRNNGDPILAKSKKLISYDLDTHELYDFVDSCDHLNLYSHYEEAAKPFLFVRPFVETLALLNTDSDN